MKKRDILRFTQRRIGAFFSLLPISFLAFLWLSASSNGFEAMGFSSKKQTIKFHYDNYILLKAKINNEHEANLLLDTGADELLLDEAYFQSTGMVIHRRQQARLPGAGGEPSTITVVLDPMNVQFDSISYTPRYVPLMDLRSIVGEKADGVIGASFLHPYLTEIDYEHETLLLHAPETVLEGFDSLKLEVRNNRYYLPASIEATDGLMVTGMFQLDLGNGGAIYLTSPTAKQYELESKITKKLKFFNVSGGAGGRIEGYQFRAKSLSIGKTKLLLPNVDWATDTSGALAKSDYAGLLGNTILERFQVVIDFKNGMLFLKPKANIRSPFVSSITGMSYVNKSASEKAVIVTGLFEGGNADKAGLKAGDKIISVNGVKVVDINDEQLSKLLRKQGKPVEIVYTRNEKVYKVKVSRKELL